MLVLPGGPLAGIGASPVESSVSLHLASAALFAIGFGVLGFLAQGRSVSAVIPVIWSGAAVFTPLALLIALYARIAHLDRSIPFAILAVIIGAAFASRHRDCSASASHVRASRSPQRCSPPVRSVRWRWG
jgi:hypothetical protein